MVDILAQIKDMNNEKLEMHEEEVKPSADDVAMEEGELPEEGEITEDEDETPTIAPAPQTQIPTSRPHGRAAKGRQKTVPTHGVSRQSKPPPKYKDFSSKSTKPVVSQDTMMASWLNGVQKKNKPSPSGHDANEEYYRLGTETTITDQREKIHFQPEIDEFGDVDYRQQIDENTMTRPERRVRRRSDSPLDDYGTVPVPKRARPTPSAAPFDEQSERLPRRTAVPKWAETTICKFFREGYCRDLENCIYSHNAADSKRRPELCRFYERGHCKRGLTCPNLHGEWPCKAYHKGECTNEPCRFSHRPLDDYTRPLFDQMLCDEEVAQRFTNAAAIRPKRRVLLPEGPSEGDQYSLDEPISIDQQSRIPHSQASSQHARQAAQSSSSYGFFNAVPSHHRTTTAHNAGNSPAITQPTTSQSGSQRTAPRSPIIDESFNLSDVLGNLTQPINAPSGSVSPSLISDSLQSLQHMFDSNDPRIIDESPASPPSHAVVVSDSAPVIPISRSYVAIPLIVPEPCSSLDVNLIQQITSGRNKNDPRLQRIAEKQFDLVSKTLEKQGGIMLNQTTTSNQISMADSTARPTPSIAAHSLPTAQTAAPKPVDPRARDPRIARNAPAGLDSNYPISSTSTAPSISNQLSSNDMDFQSMVQQQIKMANEMAVQQQSVHQNHSDLDMRSQPMHERYDARQQHESYGRRVDSSPTYRSGPRGRRGGPSVRGVRNTNFVPLGPRSGRFEDDGHLPSRRHRPDDRWPTDGARSNSTSPRDLPSEHSNEQSNVPMTLREKRKNNEYESPLARTTRF
ncbi:hypothetical protein M3Y95_01012100 [Aphelenchoides besseyi]|nr:hypothetical protein M3Y95_01012100 [Aphelenchoides besseyi]